MKKRILLLAFGLIIAFSPMAFADLIGVEMTTLNGIYGRSWDWKGWSRYELWRVLNDAGYAGLASDVKADIKGTGTPSSNYHVYKDTFWQADGYNTKFIAEVAGYAPNNRFGWYEKGYAGEVGNTLKSTWGELFSGPDTSGKTADFFNSNEIGFWINPNGVSGSYYFTDTGSNSGNLQAVIFSLGGYNGFGNNEYLIALEDLPYCSSDKDYQDMIIRLKTQPVPEPSTLLLSVFVSLWGGAFIKKFKKERR